MGGKLPHYNGRSASPQACTLASGPTLRGGVPERRRERRADVTRGCQETPAWTPSCRPGGLRYIIVPMLNKTAFITGASRGIGRACAKALAAAGARVVLAARDLA